MKPALTTVNATGKHTASVIFFHGSGDTGPNVLEWVRFLIGRNLEYPHIKIIYPTAPKQKYTPLDGELSNVWFDRKSVNIAASESKKSMSQCYDAVNQLIDEEVASGIPLNRIVVGGFSMGGALALHTGYHCVLLSCWTDDIYLSYLGYVLYGGLFAFTITVAR